MICACSANNHKLAFRWHGHGRLFRIGGTGVAIPLKINGLHPVVQKATF
jgi:hypothetical protein